MAEVEVHAFWKWFAIHHVFQANDFQANDFPFRQVSFGKVGRTASLPNLGPLYTEQRALKAAKVKDLHSLLMFVPPVYHEFYNSIKAETSAHMMKLKT